jgi:4-aminobutyrate aminotransferase-like enzyme
MTTRQTLQLLRAHVSRNVTFLAPDGSWPIVWERASGVHVWDAGGMKYLELTAAFGVAAAGHANSRVVHSVARRRALERHWLHPAADYFGESTPGSCERTQGGVTALQGCLSYPDKTL